MNSSRRSIRQAALASVMIVALGTLAISGQVSAGILTPFYAGWLSMVNPDGAGLLNIGDSPYAPMYGYRTP